MIATLLAHLRSQWMGALALLLVLTGGTAYALDGSNTVFTDDLVNGDVKVADIGQGAVATEEIANNQVKAADIGDGEVKSADIANGQVGSADIGAGEVKSGNVANDNLTGGDIAGNSLKGADIDEATLDIGDAARAYAVVSIGCGGPTGPCTFAQSKGISSVTRSGTGVYCIIAPGIDAVDTPAAVTVDWNGTVGPEGNASAMSEDEFGCGASGKGFQVRTEREPDDVFGPAEPDNTVGFSILIP